MTSIRDEIVRATRALGLRSDDCHILSPEEGDGVFRWLEAQCVRTPGRTWWWEVLQDPSASHAFDSKAYTRLELIAPDPSESVWFIADSDAPDFVVCETSVANAQRLIGECYGFEYVIGSKDGRWAIGENHHDVLWVVGATVVDGLRRAAVSVSSGHGGSPKPRVENG
jgi:hypothetical protein